MTKDEFVAHLVNTCPETRQLVEDHRVEFDNGVLLHLLMADVRRFAIAAFEAHDSEVLARCLDAVAAGISGENDEVDNAVAVSFVEDTQWWDERMAPFIATWPTELRAEVARQQAASGDA